jgi:hypothetical protein
MINSHVIVKVSESDIVHAVISLSYYRALILVLDRAPPDIYEGVEYKLISSPFSFTTLNEQLPFKATEYGLTMRASGSSVKEKALTQFHLESIRIYKQFNLEPSTPWFIHAEADTEASIKLKETYDRFKQSCILTA